MMIASYNKNFQDFHQLKINFINSKQKSPNTMSGQPDRRNSRTGDNCSYINVSCMTRSVKYEGIDIPGEVVQGRKLAVLVVLLGAPYPDKPRSSICLDKRCLFVTKLWTFRFDCYKSCLYPFDLRNKLLRENRDRLWVKNEIVGRLLLAVNRLPLVLMASF